MKTEIIKTLSEVPQSEINRGGVFTFRSWESLKPLLGESVRLRADERITGIVIDEDGVNVKTEIIKK